MQFAYEPNSHYHRQSTDQCSACARHQFILGGQSKGEVLHKNLEHLIAALAESKESRLRFSLIPLFLEHHEFFARVCAIAKKLEPFARRILQ